MTASRGSWSWEELDPSRSATSGDLAKIFKNEGSKLPSLLSRNAPRQTATLLAREVIQNSWDAARELRAGTEDDMDPFAITFDFRSLTGTDRSDFVDALGLDELHERAEMLDRRALGLGEHDCLTHLHTAGDLPVLVIEESGATGMYGPWSSVDSKLYLALLSHGFTVKGTGAGGSHGYGKAGLITGSLTRTVVAYTCFQERDDDPGVTRRLLAITYWGPHERDDRRYSGFGRLGARLGGLVVPLENEEADELAARLGLTPRSPEELDELGTSFVLLDPSIGAEELTEAVERNWWPAILDGSFDVDIITPTERIVPRPRANETLRPFIRGWELATTPQDNTVGNEWTRRLNNLTLSSGETVESGRIGLVADPDGWSFPLSLARGGVDDEIEHRSLVALVRSPRMVVEYFDAGRTAPFVRGAFVAAAQIDDLLRQTEPKAHDRWQTDPSNLGLDPDAPFVAKSILDRVSRNVRDFRDRLRPAAIARREVQLTELDRLMSEVLQGRGRSAPRTVRPATIELRLFDEAVELADPDGTIRTRARIGIRRTTSAGDLSIGSVTIRARIHEEGRSGTPCALTIAAPDTFTQTTDGTFDGQVSTDWSMFTVATDPYRADWTCRLSAEAELHPTTAGSTS